MRENPLTSPPVGNRRSPPRNAAGGRSGTEKRHGETAWRNGMAKRHGETAWRNGMKQRQHFFGGQPAERRGQSLRADDAGGLRLSSRGLRLATVVGVLIEVPVMLSVCWIVNRSKDWYERGALRKTSIAPADLS
jgi:hypothetical protein